MKIHILLHRGHQHVNYIIVPKTRNKLVLGELIVHIKKPIFQYETLNERTKSINIDYQLMRYFCEFSANLNTEHF